MPKLNILPKKSWHVYSSKNREKVKHDEEKARIQVEREDARRLKTEREYRLEVLRKRTRETDSEAIPASSTSKHINLFAAEEAAFQTATEKEIHKRKQMEEKYTVYLGKKDSKELDPWYTKRKTISGEKSTSSKSGPSSSTSNSKKAYSSLDSEDPLSLFKDSDDLLDLPHSSGLRKKSGTFEIRTNRRY